MKQKWGILGLLLLMVLGLFVVGSVAATGELICIWEGDVSTDFNVAGNWDCGVVPGSSDNVTINDTATVFPIMSANATVNNLAVEENASLDANGKVLTVNGTLTNNGILKDTQTINAGAGNDFFNTGGYGGVHLKKTTAGAASPGLTTVIIRQDQTCRNAPDTIHRCFDIEPAVKTGVDVDAIFYFAPGELNGLNCSLLRMFRWNGTDWVPAAPLGSNDCETVVSPNYAVVADGITDFSPFLGGVDAPTASFSRELYGSRQRGGCITLGDHHFGFWACNCGGNGAYAPTKICCLSASTASPIYHSGSGFQSRTFFFVLGRLTACSNSCQLSFFYKQHATGKKLATFTNA